MSIKKIAVLHYNSFNDYLISHLKNSKSISISIEEDVDSIVQKILPINAKFVAFHIDISCMDKFFKDNTLLSEILNNYRIITINSKLSNICKDTLQKYCINTGINSTLYTPSSDMGEKLIIKSKYNFGGFPEYNLSQTDKQLLNVDINYVPISYKVIMQKQLKDIDKKMYHIEKFIENQDHLFYRAYKLFNRLVISEVIDDAEIKKMPIGIKRTNYFFNLDSIDESNKFYSMVYQIDTLSKSMNIEYGAFDIVMSDEQQFYIIDVNHTPYWGPINYNNNTDLELIEYLNLGLKNA